MFSLRNSIMVTAAQCPMGEVENSNRKGGLNGATGDTVEIRCDDGYSGSKNASCVANGPGKSVWRNIPTCVG